MTDAPTLVLVGAELAGLALAILTSAEGWKAFRVAGSRLLLLFTAGFAALAAAKGFAVALELAAATSPVIVREGFDAFDLLFWGYLASEVGGFALLLASAGRRHLRRFGAFAPLLLVAGPVGQAVVLALLFLMVLNLGLNHIEHPRVGSLQTALGFFLLLLGHFLFLFGYEPLSPRNLPGELVSLLGIGILYAAAARSLRGA